LVISILWGVEERGEVGRETGKRNGEGEEGGRWRDTSYFPPEKYVRAFN